MKKALCLVLAFVLSMSYLIPNQAFATDSSDSSLKKEVPVTSDVLNEKIPEMAEEADMDTADYILNNLKSSMANKTAGYSEKELKHVKEDPLVVNLGEGNLTTIDQIETTSQETFLNTENYSPLRYAAAELQTSDSEDEKASESPEVETVSETQTESETAAPSEAESDVSSQTESDKKSNGLLSTVHSLLINYCLVDPELVKDGVTTVSIWDDTPEAFLASYSVATTLYTLEGLDDCFVAFINPGAMNGRADAILDATFTDTDATNPVNYTDKVLVDKKAGIAYIPKSIYFNEKGEEIPYDLLAQVLVGYDMEQEYNGINVTIENNDPNVQEVAEKQTVVGSSLDIRVTIPVATPETAKNLDLSRVRIFVNGNTSPVSFGDKEYYYNEENGELTIALAPITIYSLRVTIDEKTIQEKVEGIAQKLRNLLITESFAQTTIRADSADDIKTLPYGTIYITDSVKEKQLFKKTVKMKYISDMDNASSTITDAIDKVYEYCYYNFASDESARNEYKYAKNGGTLDQYLKDEGFGHVENSDPSKMEFKLFNFFLQTPTGSSTATTDSSAKMMFNIKTDIDYLALHCVENISKSEAIDSITPTGGWQNAEVWFRVLKITDSRIILGICGPHCTTQAAYGVFSIELDTKFEYTPVVNKRSADPSFTNGNSNYSLQGAEFTLYEGFFGDAVYYKSKTAWDNREVIGTYKTDSNGKIRIENLPTSTPHYIYFIQETKPSKGFALCKDIYALSVRISGNSLVYSITLSKDGGETFYALNHWPEDNRDAVNVKPLANGGSFTFDIDEPLNSGFAQLVKTNSVDTSKIVPGAKYQVYTDSACTKKAKTVDGSNALFTTTSTGSNKLELAVGTYYVKETESAPNFELDTTVHTLKIEAGKTTTLGGKGSSALQDVPFGEAYLQKVSADTNMTDGNRCYSIEGAVYKVYSDSACKKEVGELVTTADGSTNKITIPAGDYWVKEVTPSPGYGLCDGTDGSNKGVHKVTVKPGETATFTCKEPPLQDPFALKLQKKDADTGEPVPVGTASLEGALFQVDYYDNTDGDTSGTPLRTWVFKTDENGKISFSNKDYLVDELSDELYVSADLGTIVYPLGTYVVKEIQPPKYYQLDGTIKLANSSSEYSVSDGVIFIIDEDENGEAKIYENGHKEKGAITADNLALDVLEKVYKGKIRVIKYDTDGTTPLAGVTFKLVGDDGTEYTGTTDSNGEIVFEELIPQHYVLTETSTVEGHELLEDNIDITIPMEMTEDEANAEGADTSKAVWDEAAGAFCFYDITYEVTNSSSLVIPVAGGTPGWLYAGMIAAFLMIGGGAVVLVRKRR